ncbi:TPA: hypothetical protein ACH1UN_002196 [Klebsiella aerogenes]
MTVSTEVDHNDYTGNGVTTSFPYTFRIFKKSDLTVQVADLNENITVLTLDTDYSVTGAGTYSGGNVVLMSPLANGWQISISRDLPVTQETDLRNQGKFFAEVHEDAFDKLTMLIQQCFSFLRLALRKPSFIANYYDALNNRIRNLRDPAQPQDAATKNYADSILDSSNSYTDKLFRRSLRVPESDVGIVPPVNVRSNMLLGFNDLGNPVAIAGQTDTADLAIKLASTAGASLVGTENGLNVQEMLSLGRIVYPEMFGVGLANPTDDDLFSSMFTALEAKPDTLLGTSLPYTIQLRGKVYTLKQSHQLDINVNIINGVLLMDGGQIIISREAAGERTRRVRLEDLKVRYVGTTYYPDALIKVSRAYNSAVINCDFWAGDTTATVTDTSSPYFGKPLRARYGLWLGSKRAWGAMIFGGEYFGGEIPCRVGYTNDHTGLTVTGGATFHHGWVGNLLLCNPAGFFVGGVNIEHSENGAWGLCITSGTNADAGSTVINPAQNGVIHGVYAYNNGNGSTGTTNAPAAVMVGYDAPGTMGFDYPGFLITSQNTAHSISISEVYAVSPKQDYAIKVRGLEGLYVDNNKVTCSVAGRAIHFSGTCARSHAYDNRNQSTGSVDEVTYDSTNKPMIGARAGTFNPSLTGSATAGVITYSTRGGNYEISNDNCKLSLWMTIGSITTQPAGNLSISLPIAIAPGQRSGSGVHCQVLLGNQTYEIHGVLDEDNSKTVTSTLNIPNRTLPVTCSVTLGTALNLFLGGQPMDGSVVRDTTDIRISIEYPVAGATYIGA